MPIKTFNSQLYFVSGATAATKVQNAASVTGLGGGRSQIPVNTLESEEDEFIAGRASPGPVTVAMIWDPTLPSHGELLALLASGEKVEWMLCYGDGTGTPTVAASAFESLTTRTNEKFIGYVADINRDAADNEVWRATLTIQRSGPITLTEKA